MKVRIFVGSSSEAVPVAEAVMSAFESEYEVVLWNINVFRPGEGYLDSLLRIAGRCNFGIFVFAPNDLRSSRGSDQSAVRDNVLFECGIFFGRLGRRRSFFLVPKNVEGLHLPSDDREPPTRVSRRQVIVRRSALPLAPDAYRYV
jgi:predicted nucleotide-binding protein